MRLSMRSGWWPVRLTLNCPPLLTSLCLLIILSQMTTYSYSRLDWLLAFCFLPLLLWLECLFGCCLEVFLLVLLWIENYSTVETEGMMLRQSLRSTRLTWRLPTRPWRQPGGRSAWPQLYQSEARGSKSKPRWRLLYDVGVLLTASLPYLSRQMAVAAFFPFSKKNCMRGE